MFRRCDTEEACDNERNVVCLKTKKFNKRIFTKLLVERKNETVELWKNESNVDILKKKTCYKSLSEQIC